jgi:ribonuclease HI
MTCKPQDNNYRTLYLYTDGSSRYHKQWFGGSGIAVVDTCQGASSTAFYALPHATSQVAELFAVIMGVRHVLTSPSVYSFNRLIIVSDSNYVIQGWTMYLPQWLQAGWRRSNGEAVSNIVYWQSLMVHMDALASCGYAIQFEKVTAHMQGRGKTPQMQTHSMWNELVDSLAKRGMNDALGTGSAMEE